MDRPGKEKQNLASRRPDQVNNRNSSSVMPTATSKPETTALTVTSAASRSAPSQNASSRPASSPGIDERRLEESISSLKEQDEGQRGQAEKQHVHSQIATLSCDPSTKGDIEDSTNYERYPRLFPGRLWFPRFNLSPKLNRDKILQRTGFLYKKYFVQGILRRKEIPRTKDGRHIELNIFRDSLLIDERTGQPYISNSIRSSRYNIWNFLPCQLWFQFSKIANLFFLVIGIVQLIPGLSTTGSFTTILPLLLFLSFTIAREGYDDFRRYQLDKVDNRKSTRVLSTAKSGGISILPSAFLNTSKEYWNFFRGGSSSAKGMSQAISIVTSNQCMDHADVSGPSDTSGAASWVTVLWKDIKVGDIIELKRNDPIPADIVLLHADGRDGIAYIETMELDGETNLKTRRPPTMPPCNTVAELSQRRASFAVEDPNLDLYNFYGKVSANGKTSPVTPDNVVYRGSTLRNTNRAIGMIINTGEECKIRMNASHSPRSKAPAIQSITNRVVILLVVFVLLLATGCTAGYQVWTTVFESNAWYLTGAHLGPAEIFIAFAIEFNNLIPLALYVSLELVKFAQFLLLHDIEMYDEISNTPMVSNTQNIYENLGQVSYIFSDKTGTLTENVMRFRKISVAGISLLHNLESPKDKGPQPVQTANPQDEPTTPTIVEHEPTGITRPPVEGFPFPAGRVSLNVPRLERMLSQEQMTNDLPMKEFLQYLWQHPNPELSKKVRLFLLSLALCHTCFPETRADGKAGFQAASPDELALVEAAAEMGYVVSDRTTNLITLQVNPSASEPPVQEVYQVLDIIEFSSKRKRMSISVKFPDGRICLFCKGADSVILPRLRLSSLAIQKGAEVRRRHDERRSFEVEDAISRKSYDEISRKSFQRSSLHLDRQSMELRNVMSARKSLVIEQRPGMHRYQSGGSVPRKSMGSRFLELPLSETGSPRPWNEARPLDDAFTFEHCLEHIDKFASEGLRTLMFGYRVVNGDEYTTWRKLFHDATTSLVNRQDMIESAAELIEKDFELAGATGIEDKLQDGVPDTIEKLQRANIKIWMLTGDKRETAINIAHSARLCRTYSYMIILDTKKGLLAEQVDSGLLEVMEGRVAHSVVVIDGQTLMEVESDTVLAEHFYELLLRVDSVICCRASPSQKANMVKSIRHRVPGSITLAIGDGGNDIAMIQEAHVGVGISGKEGLQAARVADYSIAQFRFLQRLLLVHGHWNYIRIAIYVLATFCT
jgi:phospholipid-translocating ATPase